MFVGFVTNIRYAVELRKPAMSIQKVLVLDEATAAVDTATDERIQTTIRFNIDLELYSILFSSTYII